MSEEAEQSKEEAAKFQDLKLNELVNLEKFFKSLEESTWIPKDSKDEQDLNSVKNVISLVRTFYPKLVANDIVGVQPMSGPTGLVFSMRPQYGRNAELEALKKEIEAMKLERSTIHVDVERNKNADEKVHDSHR